MEIVIRGLTPLSYNSKKKTAYQEHIRSAFKRKYHGSVPMFDSDKELYARVYYFTSEGVNVDCDNISKPIWDAVNKLVYDDDRMIVMRTAAVIDMNVHQLISIDASSIDSEEAVNLMQGLFEENAKCLYIECGEFKESMIKIGQ